MHFTEMWGAFFLSTLDDMEELLHVVRPTLQALSQPPLDLHDSTKPRFKDCFVTIFPLLLFRGKVNTDRGT